MARSSLSQTRWHEDDLAGRLLAGEQVKSKKVKGKSKAKEHWSVVCLPALAEENDPLKRRAGQALCHQRFPVKALLERKAEMGSYSFAALYQQTPVPAGGELFKTRMVLTHFVVAAARASLVSRVRPGRCEKNIRRLHGQLSLCH